MALFPCLVRTERLLAENPTSWARSAGVTVTTSQLSSGAAALTVARRDRLGLDVRHDDSVLGSDRSDERVRSRLPVAPYSCGIQPHDDRKLAPGTWRRAVACDGHRTAASYDAMFVAVCRRNQQPSCVRTVSHGAGNRVKHRRLRRRQARLERPSYGALHVMVADAQRAYRKRPS